LLRYLHYKGLVETDLSLAVPKVARWRLSTLPKHLPAAQVRQLLHHCDRKSALGRRNYAILLLLARLGLRAGEVVKLRLEDVDWENARITIYRCQQTWQKPLRITCVMLGHGVRVASCSSETTPPSKASNVEVRLGTWLSGR
jgi:integrase